tara:strand:+ start:2696 stop:3430 length:735 start_codon:yes stop_codon:yes gene_type:complete
MEIELVLLATAASLIAAALTVPAGFGLSTMLTPVVLMLMGPHEAIAVVAIVHGAHNGGKSWALWSNIDFDAFKRYGIWLILGSVIGAFLQNQVPQKPLLGMIGLFLVILPLLSLNKSWKEYRLSEANEQIGGFGSGFMGGLSGHQGALRAIFLTNKLPDKMAYAATASIFALCVDLSRIPIYLFFRSEGITANLELTLTLVIAALIGVSMGKKWLKSMKSESIRKGIRVGIITSGFFYLFEALT